MWCRAFVRRLTVSTPPMVLQPPTRVLCPSLLPPMRHGFRFASSASSSSSSSSTSPPASPSTRSPSSTHRRVPSVSPRSYGRPGQRQPRRHRAAASRPLPPRRAPGGAASATANAMRDTVHQSLEVVDPALVPLDTEASAAALPNSISAPPPGMAWSWDAELRTAVLTPVGHGWTPWVGSGRAFGLHTRQLVVCPPLEPPTAPTPATPHVLGLLVTRYTGVFAGSSAITKTHQGVAEFLTALNVQRASPAAEAAQLAAAMAGQWADDNAPSPTTAAATATAATPPVQHDSWEYEVMPGVALSGVEYSVAHWLNGAPAAASPAEAAAGMRYHVTVVTNTVEDVVFEVEFRAPSAQWQPMWRQFGEALTSDVFLNWSDASDARFT